MSKKIETYVDVVRKNIEGYRGPLSDVIKYAPMFYELFESLIKEKNLDKNTHPIINSVVAYFVLPNDVIPEDEYGPFGYVDYLYLCVYVINKLFYERKVIKQHWKGDEDVIELSSEIDAVADVRPIGDINGDDDIDYYDIEIFAKTWLTQWPDPCFNPAADFAVDNKIDLFVYAQLVRLAPVRADPFQQPGTRSPVAQPGQHPVL